MNYEKRVRRILNRAKKDNFSNYITILKELFPICDHSMLNIIIGALSDSEISISKLAAFLLGNLITYKAPNLMINESINKNTLKLENITASKISIDFLKLKPLIALLEDENAEIRCEAVKALGRIGDPRTINKLVDLLTDTNAKVRIDTIYALGAFKDSRTLERIIKSLKEDSNLLVRSNAAALGTIRDSKAIESLLKAASNEVVRVRWNAIRSLGIIGDSRAIPLLKRILHDEDAHYCDYAMTETSLAMEAANALVKIGDSDAVEVLLDSLTAQNADVRCETARTFAILVEPRSVEPLLKLLKDKYHDVRENALLALENQKNEKTVPSIIDALEDKSEDVRIAAARVLGMFGDPRALEPLEKHITPNSPSARRIFREAIQNIKKLTSAKNQ